MTSDPLPASPPVPLPARAPSLGRPQPSLVERALEEGVDQWSPPDLVALLLSRGSGPARRTVERARRLVTRFGDLRRLAIATPGEVAVRGGLAPAVAARVVAAFALARRAAEPPWPRGTPILSARDVFDRFHPRLRHLRRERFLAVLVDAKNRVLREDVVGEGGLASVPVQPREAFGPALREAASGVVFVHNHPSGDPEPSDVDVEVTQRLVAAGELLGIRVLDHLVIGDATFVSLRERGIVPG